MGFIRSRFIIAVLICIVLSSSCVSASARAEKQEGEPPAGPSNRTEAVTGGYTQIDISADRAETALELLSEHLAKDGLTLEGPFEAWQQVVAGYKIRIDCSYIQNGIGGVLTGIVYFPPDGEAKVLDVIISPPL